MLRTWQIRRWDSAAGPVSTPSCAAGEQRFSLGTKNKTLQYNADGSLTLYAGAKSPGKDKETNWLPAPETPFSLYIRAYWAKPEIVNGSWMPPKVERV